MSGLRPTKRGALLALAIGAAFGAAVTERAAIAQAVQYGFAQVCPTCALVDKSYQAPLVTTSTLDAGTVQSGLFTCTASSGNDAYDLTAGAHLSLNGSGGTNYLADSAGNALFNHTVQTNATGNSYVAPSGGAYCMNGTACSNYIWTPAGQATNIVNANGVNANGNPVAAVHSALMSSPVAVEYGADAGVSGAMGVTFATAFAQAPVCTCSSGDATSTNGCTIGTAATTAGVTFKATTTDRVTWICIGPK